MASRAPGDADARAPLEAIAAGIAHEVRNPLNALQINLSILAQELSEIVPDRGSHVFEVIRRIAEYRRSLLASAGLAAVLTSGARPAAGFLRRVAASPDDEEDRG